MSQPPHGNRYPGPGQPPHQYQRPPGNAWQGQGQPYPPQQQPPQQWPPNQPPGQPPGQPQWQQQPGPPPPAEKGSRRTLVIALVVVAVLVLGGGGFWLFTRDSGGADASGGKEYDAAVEKLGAAEVSWRVGQGPAPGAIGVEDFWTTDELLVRRLPDRVVGYDLKSGDEAWTYDINGQPKDHCRSSMTPSDNKVALLIATNDDTSDNCGRLVVLDLTSGEEVWTAEFGEENPDPNDKTARRADPDNVPASNGDVPAIFAGKVLFGGKKPRAFDLTNGQPTTVPESYSACAPDDLAVMGEALLAEMVCDAGDGKTLRRLKSFDANLAAQWEWTTPVDEKGEPIPVMGVLSVEPLIIELGHLGHESQIVVADPATGDGKPIEAYDAGKHEGEFMNACDDYALGTCHNGTVVDGKLILTTRVDQINPGDPEAGSNQATEFRNELVAFDPATGEEAWRTGKVSGRMISMVRAEGVVVFQPENANGGKAMVLSVNPADGSVEPVMALGPRVHEQDSLMSHRRAFYFGGDNHQAIYRDGLFIMFSITHRTDSQDKADTVAFAVE